MELLITFLAIGGYGYMVVKTFKLAFKAKVKHHINRWRTLDPHRYTSEFVADSVFASILWPFTYLHYYNKGKAKKVSILDDWIDEVINPDNAKERDLWKS